MEQKITSTIRLRMSSQDAHYGGNLVDGAHMLALFGDVATELPASSLELVDKKEISYSFDLTTSKQICDLLTMTPYVYRAPKASVENVKSKTCLDLTADFCMCVLKKSSR